MNLTQTETILTSAVQYRDYSGGYFNVLISPDQTDGALGMVDMRLPKGAEPPPHIHHLEDETFLVLEGEVLIRVGDQKVTLKAGEATFGPRGIEHEFRILSAEARIVITITPGDFVNFFLEYSSPTNGQPKIVPPQAPPPVELIQQMIARLDERYSLSFA